jgi:hypothetical protein
MMLYGDIGNRFAAGLKRACSFFEQRAASMAFAAGFLSDVGAFHQNKFGVSGWLHTE